MSKVPALFFLILASVCFAIFVAEFYLHNEQETIFWGILTVINYITVARLEQMSPTPPKKKDESE